MRHSEPASPAGSVNPQSEPPADWGALFSLLVERGWVVGLCVAFALLGAAYYAKRAPRIYEATATVQVEQEEQRPVKLEQGKEDLRTLEVMNTIVQKLSSRPLLERVLATNGLAFAPQAGSAGKPPPTREQLLAALAGRVKVSLRRNTRLIDVKATHSDPLQAAQIANSVVEQYMSQDFEFRSAATRGAFAYLNAESERLKKKLEASEQTLQSYREEVGSVSMLKGDDLLLPQLRELNLRMAQAKGESIRFKTAYEQVAHSRGNVSEMLTAPQIAGDPAVIEARSIVAKLESDFALIQQRYKEKHPKYIQAASQLEEARRALSNCALKAAESLRVAYENAQGAEKGMGQSIHEAEDAALKLSQKAIHYNLLAREVESDQALFDNVLNRLKETSLATDMQSEKMRLIAPATPPAVPASPKLAVVFGAALLAGLLVGAGLAFAWGAFDTSFKTVEDAEQYLRLPVLTVVLRLREVRKSRRPLLKTDDAYSPANEAFRTLRTSLAMLGREDQCRTFLFTSALPQEGKTFSSINFAASLAQQGLRTLLIDADLRRPCIAGYLASGPARELPGVSDYLLGRKSLPELVRPKEGLEHFFWMAAGFPPANPADLLAQGEFRNLIADALKEFDRVVIDSAPINVVSDTLLIANYIHTTVLVVHGRKTPRKAVLRCLQLLHKAGARVDGVVLNLLPRRRSRGYNYYSGYCDPGHSTEVKNHQPKRALVRPVQVLDKTI
jgi:polysaccharide biosynthesis transport protein